MLKKLQPIRRKFVALCYIIHSLAQTVTDKVMLIPFKYVTYPLYMRRQIDPVFVINVFLGCKSWSSFMGIFNLRVFSRNLRDFPLFHVSPSFKRRLSARGATAANAVFTDLDIFRRQIIILRMYSLFSICVLCFVWACFMCILLTVLCYLCCYVVPMTQDANKQ
jgi:hypothetical protein